MRKNLKKLLGVLLALTLLLSLAPVAFAEGEAPSKAHLPTNQTREKVNVKDGDEPLVGYYFEDDTLDNWTFAYGDAAEAEWIWSGNNEGGYEYEQYAHEGSGFLMAYSFIDYVGAFQADGYAISPAIELPDESATLSFYATNANASYPETFSVYVGTSADVETMTKVLGPTYATTGPEDDWQHYEIDLSAYLGQEIYVAFYDGCYDMYELWIDAVEIYGEGDLGGGNEGGQLTVANGTDTNSYVPVYGFYADAYTSSQTLYPAADLAAMTGNDITELTYYASQSSVSWGNAKFDVYMAETDATALNANAGFIDVATMTKVLDGKSLSIDGNGKMVVTLDTAYTYQGGNLLICVQGVETGDYVSSTWYGVTVEGASISGYNYSSLADVSTATQRNFLPKTSFAYRESGIPVTITANDASKTYGAEDPELTATVEGVDDSVELDYTLSRKAGEAVGTYTIKVKKGSNPGYAITTVKGTFTIEKATPQLADVEATAIYLGDTLGDSVITGTATNPNNGEEVSGTWAFVEADTVPALEDSMTTEYAVTFTPDDTQNYNEATINIKLVVNKPLPIYTAPEGLDLLYLGVPQELVLEGETDEGVFLYSLDGENFSEEIPTGTDLGEYEIWYMVKADDDHSDTQPELIFSTINLWIYGPDTDTAMIAFAEEGERLYRYDVHMGVVPEGFEIIGAQVFLAYDEDVLTLERVENGDIDWTVSTVDNKVMAAWADLDAIQPESNQVLFSLVFSLKNGAQGIAELPFIANPLGLVSSVTVLEDNKTVDVEVIALGGSVEVFEPLWGDANCDGRITSADAALILRAIVGLNELDPHGAYNADVDGDLAVTAADAAAILRYVVNLIDTLPVA